MTNYLKAEFKRMIKSKTFICALILAISCAFLSAIYMIENNARFNPDVINQIFIKDGRFTRNPHIQIMDFFHSWVGGEGLSIAHTIFYSLLPILSAMPYAWTYHSEIKSGYYKMIVTKIGKIKYLFGKAIISFVSGVLVSLVPLVINILFVSANIPWSIPLPTDTIYNHVEFGDMWAEIYYTNPFIYVLLYVILTIITCGIFSLVSLSIGLCTKSLLSILFGPFLLFTGISYCETLISGRIDFPYEFVPSQFLHSAPLYFRANDKVVAIVLILLLVLSVAIIARKGLKDEVI